MIRGRLDRYVVIKSVSVSQDSIGQAIETFSTFASVWAERRDIRGSERFEAQQVLPMRISTFRIPWMTGIRENMRLVDSDGSTYQIKGVAEDQRRNWIELTCEAQNPVATA